MQINSFKTHSAKPADVQDTWHIIDAEGMIVGRLATRVAAVLRGKHRANYTPHVDLGDHVIIINADKVRFTGKKETKKVYFHHTGYPGGAKTTTPEKLRAKHPTRIIEKAVRGMIPHTKLGNQLRRKLRVYAGSEHPHQGQEPQTLTL